MVLKVRRCPATRSVVAFTDLLQAAAVLVSRPTSSVPVLTRSCDGPSTSVIILLLLHFPSTIDSFNFHFFQEVQHQNNMHA